MRAFLSLLIIAIIFSSCLVRSRMAYHQQVQPNTNLTIQGGPTLIIPSIPINNLDDLKQIIQRIIKIDPVHIHTRAVAKENGLQVPAYIAPDSMSVELSKLKNESNYQYLLLMDGYPMPTENNGGHLVSTLIEVWDIPTGELIYNSHSTVKSKVRTINNDRGTFWGNLFNGTVGEPLSMDYLLQKGFIGR